MGKRGATRVTAADIAKMGDLPSMIKKLIRQATEGDAEAKEAAATMLSSLAFQNHHEHIGALFKAGAIAPLVDLLKSGSTKAQQSAASALHALLVDKPRHQAAMVDAGGVRPLVSLLKTGSAKVQEEAASTLASMDADVAHQREVLAAGGIIPLIAMLKGGSATAQAFAARALANAAAYRAEGGQDAIVKAGAIGPLLVLLKEGKAQMPAARALARLASDHAMNQSAIAAAGGIAPLLALLNGRDVLAQMEAAAALAEMARGNADTQSAIAKAGGIGPLLALLGSRSAAAQANGMAALAELAAHHPDNQLAIARQGGIKPLVALLDEGGLTSAPKDPEVPAHAAFALMEIARGNLHIQQSIVDCGGISQLGSLIKSSAHAKVKAEVAGALWSLAEEAVFKPLIAAEGAVSPLVQLLGLDGVSERAQRHASHALLSLALHNAENQVAVTQQLIDLLSNGSDEAQARAAQALWALVGENPEEHSSIAKAGDPAKLVALLTSALEVSRDFAIWALSLAISPDNQKVITEAGGIQPLIEQLQDPRDLKREQASTALAKLAAGENDEARAAITKHGGVAPLLAMIEEPSSPVTISPDPSPTTRRPPPSTPPSTAAAAASIAQTSRSTSSAAAAAATGGSASSAAVAGGDGGGTAGSTAPKGAGGSRVEETQGGIRTRGTSLSKAASEREFDRLSSPGPMRSPSVRSERSASIASGGVWRGEPRVFRSPHDGVLEAAAFALANLAADPAARQAIVTSGGVGPLVELLRESLEPQLVLAMSIYHDRTWKCPSPLLPSWLPHSASAAQPACSACPRLSSLRR